MNKEKLEKKLLTIVRRVLPEDPNRPPLSMATKIIEDPLVDSLTIATLGFSIAEEFHLDSEIIFPLLVQFNTVNDAVDLIRPLLEKE